MAKKISKRAKLLAAIDLLFLQKGFDVVTISEIAFLAKVPMGNVYYYFKTKKDMIQEVLKLRHSNLKSELNTIEKTYKQPKTQLQSFINLFIGYPKTPMLEEINSIYKEILEIKEEHIDYPSLGKFITILLLDIEKENNNNLHEYFLPIIEDVLAWCKIKFIELNKTEQEAEVLSTQFFNALLGPCIFSLNKNFNSGVLYYISFINKSFGLEY